MAILHTDNITGNDTSGNGSIALPYKTINKAMTVGNNGDEIRVAGSGFTALPGTVTATTNASTTWNTSVDLVGILYPQDIITVNDAEFGDQKFFYKVQTITSTQITVDSAWNRTPNVPLTFSYITQQHYATAATNVTFENVNIAGKFDFKITGGWTNSFAAQDGWTVMAYRGPTATSRSGTGFTAITGLDAGAMYFDKFMLSHLSTGFAGSTNRWFVGTLAFVYFTTTSPFGAGATTNHSYGASDLYLTNSILTTALGSNNITNDNQVGLNYRNVWYAYPLGGNITTTVLQYIENWYAISNNFTSGIQNGVLIGLGTVVNNLNIQTQNAPGNTENITVFGPGGGVITNDINVVGDNLTGYNLVLNATTNINYSLQLTSKKIEDFRLFGVGSAFNVTMANVRIKDIEGEKQVFATSGVVFADSSTFDTGTNSLKLYKASTPNVAIRVPIYSFFNSDTTAKNITIRAKASANTNVIFSLLSPKNQIGASQGASIVNYRPQTFALTTDWQTFTYTQIDVATSERISEAYAILCANVSGIDADYIWIDSVTIS